MSARPVTLSAAALLLGASIVHAAPAGAAEPQVSPAASCVAKVFVPQALDGPGTIARRIAEIKGFTDVNFGASIAILRGIDC